MEYGDAVEIIGNYAKDKWGDYGQSFLCARMARGQGLPQGA